MTYLMIEAALRALGLAAVAGLGLMVLRVRNVPARKAAWSMVLIASMAMPLLMRWPANFARRFAWVVPIRMTAKPLPQKQAIPVPVMMTVRGDGQLTSTARWRPVAKKTIAAPIVDGSQDAFSDSAPGAFHWPAPAKLAVWIYLTVGGALLLRLIWGLIAAIHLWATAERVSPLVAPAGYVRASARIASPVTIGSGIVLPADYTQWTPRKRRMVLAHEQSHVRQLDFYLQLLAGLYTVLFWFSPLGWLLRRTLASLGERIADREGIHAGQSRSGYAELVLEFAAMPRTNLQGVAMACSGNLTHRIESMLNERVFRSAFTEGRRRAAVALLTIPIAVFAVTALVRVPVAAAAMDVCPGATASDGPLSPKRAIGRHLLPVAGFRTLPERGLLTARLETIQSVAPVPQPRPAASADQAAPPAPAPAPQVAPVPQAAPAPPPPGEQRTVESRDEHGQDQIVLDDEGEVQRNGSGFYFSSGGEAWAIVNNPGARNEFSFSGRWDPEVRQEIEAAKRQAHGPALWFRHNGKSYLLDDPATVARIEQMYKPMQALGAQQEALGKQQEELGRQMEELAETQRNEIKVRLPDFSKEMADLQAAAAKMKMDQGEWSGKNFADLQSELSELKAKQGQMMTPEQLGQIEEKIARAQARFTSDKMMEFQARFAELQGRLGALQGEMGAQQGAFGAKMGALGAQQGKLGAQQGRLGAEQGRLAIQAQREVRSIIEQALRNGRAKPVQ